MHKVNLLLVHGLGPRTVQLMFYHIYCNTVDLNVACSQRPYMWKSRRMCKHTRLVDLDCIVMYDLKPQIYLKPS